MSETGSGGRKRGNLFDDLAGVAGGAFSALAGVRGEVEAAPVEIVHAKALEAAGRGVADAAVVEGQHVDALGRDVLGKSLVEALWHRGGTADHEVGARWRGGVVAPGRQRIAVGGVQGEAFDAHGVAGGGCHVGFSGVGGAGNKASKVSVICCTGSMLCATRACSRPPS